MQLKQMTWRGKHLKDMSREELMYAMEVVITMIGAQDRAEWLAAEVRHAAEQPTSGSKEDA